MSIIKPEKTIEVAKYFSWFSFLLIIVSSVFLTFILGRSMLISLLDSQKEYALLVAEDFNQQLFRKFTVPIAISQQTISLSDPEQYRFLNETVESLLTGLAVKKVRILNNEGAVVYSTNIEEVKEKVLEGKSLENLYNFTIPYTFEEANNTTYLEAFLQREVYKDSFLLDIYYPLSVDKDLSEYFEKAPLLGVLQLTIDISKHYQNAIDFQRLVFLILVLSCLFLFVLLQYIARRAESLISERIEHNKHLEAQLHHQEKLASMGRVVASIAHEIRNPLGIIQSSTELLASRNKATMDTASLRILDAMMDELKRLGVLVNDFLDYARPRKLNLKEVDLLFCLTKVLTFLENKISSSQIKLEVQTPEKAVVFGEDELLYRAIYNVISNAIQAVEEKENPMLAINLEVKENKDIAITICDNGGGFSDEVLKNALDPFFTTKEKGTGLGLPIVRSIVQAHGGEINLYNKDEGACVELCFKYSENN